MATPTLSWIGPSGRMDNAVNWYNGIVPRAGQNAQVRNGSTAIAHGPEGNGVNLALQNNSVISLMDGSVGTVTVDASQYTYVQSSYGKIEVAGTGSTAGITLGHVGGQPDYLTMTVGGSYTSYGAISVVGGSVFSETGTGSYSHFTNEGTLTTSGGSTVQIGSDFAGGMVTDSLGANGQGSLIRFGGAVGHGTQISLNVGTLQLDKPMQFHATIAHLNTTAAAASGPLSGLGNGSILLEHIYAETGSFTSSELILKHQGATVADLRFTGLGAPGHASLFLTAEAGGSMAVTGYAIPGSFAIHA